MRDETDKATEERNKPSDQLDKPRYRSPSGGPLVSSLKVD